MGELVSKFLRHVVPGVVRPLHALWNEVIGFLFLVIAVVAAGSLIRRLYAFEGDPKGLFEIVILGLACLVMGYYGVSSFLRARKITRS